MIIANRVNANHDPKSNVKDVEKNVKDVEKNVASRRPKRGDHLTLEVADVSAEGLGIAQLSILPPAHTAEADDTLQQPPSSASPAGPRSYAIGVPGALPGEQVLAEIGGRRGAYVMARIERILRALPERISPRCRHFKRLESSQPGCGGCSLQSIGYQAQLRLKHERVKRLIHAVGFDPGVVAYPIAQAEPWFYRNKMEYTFSPDPSGHVVLGLHPAGSRRVLQIDECYLLSPFAALLLPHVTEWARALGLTAYWPSRNSGFLRTLTIREGKRTAERLVDLTTSADELIETRDGSRAASDIAQSFLTHLERMPKGLEAVTSVYWTRHVARRGNPTTFDAALLHGSPVLHEALHLPAGHRLYFEIHPRAFFQPATLQAEALYAQVLRAAAVERGQVALDLYCGTGTIALCLAPFCEQVIGIERQEEAVESACRNALRNGLDNVRFIAGDVGNLLARGLTRSEGLDPDLVVIDPPRAGLTPPALAQIQAVGAPRLVYVSCNPEALARDLLALARYGYTVQTIQPVDMFPQTAHIECVARLDRYLLP